MKRTNLFVVSIYARKDDRKLFIKGLKSLFDKLHLHHPDNMYIIAADLNARWTDRGDRVSNARGRLLSIWEATDALNFKANILTLNIPTYTPAQSFLDICLADTRTKIPPAQLQSYEMEAIYQKPRQKLQDIYPDR